MTPWGSKIRKIEKNGLFFGIIPLYFGVFPFLEKVGPRRKCRLFYRHKRLQFPGTFWAVFGGGYPYPPANFPQKPRKLTKIAWFSGARKTPIFGLFLRIFKIIKNKKIFSEKKNFYFFKKKRGFFSKFCENCSNLPNPAAVMSHHKNSYDES